MQNNRIPIILHSAFDLAVLDVIILIWLEIQENCEGFVANTKRKFLSYFEFDSGSINWYFFFLSVIGRKLDY